MCNNDKCVKCNYNVDYPYSDFCKNCTVTNGNCDDCGNCDYY